MPKKGRYDRFVSPIKKGDFADFSGTIKVLNNGRTTKKTRQEYGKILGEIRARFKGENAPGHNGGIIGQ